MLFHASVPLPVDIEELADEFSFAYKLMHDLVARIAPALVSNLQELSGFFGRLHHFFCVFEAVGHLLFAVHVQAFFQRRNSHGGVHPVGSGNNHRVKALFLRQHLLVALVWCDVMLVGPLEPV